MSQENVEVVKRATAAYLAHDNEAALALYDPDIEIQGGFDGSAVYRGLSGVREYYSDWLGAIDLSGLEVEEWIDAGDDVIATFRHWGEGKLSGVPVEQRRSDVWTVRNGKLWRMRSFASRDEALKAVGLEE
jgi:ketosteroid isomerase-like protein